MGSQRQYVKDNQGRNPLYIKAFLLGFLAVLIVSIILLSWVPPVSKDALAHHLIIPKLYLKHGGVYEIPLIEFSYYPMNLDLLYMIPLYFKNDIAPKFIHFVFALLTAWLIFGYLKHRINAIYGLLGAIFFLSIPIIVKLSTTVYVDLGVMFFSTASLLLILKWIQSGFRMRILLFSAILCGLALGTKYNGLVTLFLLTLFIPYLYSRYKKDKRYGFFKSAGQGLIFFFVAILVFSPWMMRNYLWKNNPIYPLYNKWFNPPVVSSVNVTAGEPIQKMNRGLFTYRSVIYNESWWQIALLPVRIFFQGKDGDPKYFDGKLNPFLLLLPVFAFFRSGEGPQYGRNEKKIMLVFAVLFFGFAFFSYSLRMRYISPIIPPLIILSLFGVKNIIEIVKGKLCSQTARQTGLALVFLMLAFAIILNAHYVVTLFRHVDPFSYLSGTLSRDEYISRYRHEYPAMQYINKNLPPDALILFIFLGRRGYYCDRKYVPDTEKRIIKLHRLIKTSDDHKEIRRHIEKMGVTHLIIQIDLFNRWMNDMFNIEERKRLQEFFRNHLKLLFSKNGVGVFDMKEL